MSTETKEKQSATLIRNVVKMWDDEYSKKETVPRKNAIDKEKKIMHKNDSEQFFAKIQLSKEIISSDLYYHFDLNEKQKSFYIRLKYKEKAFVDLKKFSEFISESKFGDINGIPLNIEENGLALGKNLIDSTPEFICDCMEKLINLTRKRVHEYIKELKN